MSDTDMNATLRGDHNELRKRVDQLRHEVIALADQAHEGEHVDGVLAGDLSDVLDRIAEIEKATAPPPDPFIHATDFPEGARSENGEIGARVYDADGNEIGNIVLGRGGSPCFLPTQPPMEEIPYEQIRAERRARDKAVYDAAREGLPPGFFREPCGLVRDRDGHIAAVDIEPVADWISVKFQEAWFSPVGFFKKGATVPVPAAVQDRLPRTATVLGPCAAPEPPVDEGAEINKAWAAGQRQRREGGF